MTSKVKTLGLAVSIAAVLSALIPPLAQAGVFEFGKNPAVYEAFSEGAQQFVIQKQTPAPGGDFNATCQGATFEGTIESIGQGEQQQVNELTATPTFGPGCQVLGTAATARANGCKYTITGAGQADNTFVIDIVGCTSGKGITFQGATCQVLIPEQNGLSHVVAKTIKPGLLHEVTLEFTISKITHTQFGACPDGNNHHGTSLTFTGNTVLKAYVDAGTSQVDAHGHKYTQHNEGAQTTATSK